MKRKLNKIENENINGIVWDWFVRTGGKISVPELN
jgi:hypothetical protein